MCNKPEKFSDEQKKWQTKFKYKLVSEAMPVIPLNIFNKDENAIYVLLQDYFGEYGNFLFPGNVQ